MSEAVRPTRLEGPAGEDASRTNRLRELLPPLPEGEAGWARALDDARARARPVPTALADRLAARQEELGAGDEAVRNARALAEPGTLAVVTGQQPGLLGGLLLTFHKAAGAIHLARQLDGVAGRRVVPVFWWASEDHDLDEANRLFLLDRQGQSARLSLPLDADGRSLMHREVLPRDAEALLTAAAEALPDTERARRLLDVLRPGGPVPFAAWAARAFCRLLGGEGLVLLEPEVWGPSAGDALADLVLRREEIRDAVLRGARALREAGLPPPVEVDPRAWVPLFVRDRPGAPRRRLEDRGDGRVAPRRGKAIDADLVVERLRREPELGSGDVVGRVLLQDALLPVLAYVGGPTELVYHVEVRAAHEAVGLSYPLAVRRPSAVWADAKAERAAQAFGVALADVVPHGPSAEPPGGGDLPDRLDRALFAVEEGALGAPPAALRPWLGQSGEGPRALERAWGQLRHAWRRDAERVRAAFARDRGVGLARWARLEALLFPRGRPQERALSALSLVARYGAEAFREGLGYLDPLDPRPLLLTVASRLS